MDNDPRTSPLYPNLNSAKRQRNQSYSEGVGNDQNYSQGYQQQNVDQEMRPRAGSASYRSFNPNYKGNHYDPFFSAKKAAGMDQRNVNPRKPTPTRSTLPPRLMQNPIVRAPTPILDPRVHLQKSLSWAKVGIETQLQELGIESESDKWNEAMKPIRVFSGQSLVKLGLKAALKEEKKPPQPPMKAFVSDEEFYSKLHGNDSEPSASSWSEF